MGCRSAAVCIMFLLHRSIGGVKGLFPTVGSRIVRRSVTTSCSTLRMAAVRRLVVRSPKRQPSRTSSSLHMMGNQHLFAELDPSRPRPKLRECLLSVPKEPGCYIMESRDGRKLYIGKSVNLSSRVPSYFSTTTTTSDGSVLPGKNLSRRIAVMTTLVERIEYIATVSAGEALLLEASLIRQHQPPFNVLLKDDKRNYPYVCVTWSEPYPRLLVTRDKPRRGGGPEDRYYGPFVDPGQVQSTIALVRRILPLRERARPLYKDKPCLNYDMGICPGACQGLISEDAYAETARLAEMVFRGEGGELLSRLEERMQAESRAERFEQAGEIKAQLALVRGGLLGSALHFSSGGVAAGGKGVPSGASSSDVDSGGVRRDVVAVGLAGGLACFQVFQVRGGRLTGRLGFTYRVEGEGLSRGEILQACLERYWGDVLKSAQLGEGEKEGKMEESLSSSPSLEGGGGKGRRNVPILDVPEEVVTADALPAGGAALLAELLSSAKQSNGSQQQKEDMVSHESERDPGVRGKKAGKRGSVSRPNGKIAGEERSPMCDVKIVHGEKGTGERYHLCKMVLKNAELEAKGLLKAGEETAQGLSQLTQMLGLDSVPARIEGYDVSHMGGGQAVASVICFVDGKVNPQNHRRYKIRSPEVRKGHSDDYASLREVIARRFSPPAPSALPSAFDSNVIPGLVVIDGGKGQLAAALEGAAIAADLWNSIDGDTPSTPTDPFGGGDVTSAAAETPAAAVFGTGRAAPGEVSARESVTTADATNNAAASSLVIPASHPLEVGEKRRDDPDAVLLTSPSLANPLVEGARDMAPNWSVDVGGGRSVTFVSLAKKEEEVFVPGAMEPLAAALEAGPNSPAVMILRQVRDEAHRFAVTYHRKLRGRDMFLPGQVGGDDASGEQQDFEAIAGLPSKLKRELAERFGSLQGARVAGEAELRRIPGVGPVLAKRILS